MVDLLTGGFPKEFKLNVTQIFFSPLALFPYIWLADNEITFRWHSQLFVFEFELQLQRNKTKVKQITWKIFIEKSAFFTLSWILYVNTEWNCAYDYRWRTKTIQSNIFHIIMTNNLHSLYVCCDCEWYPSPIMGSSRLIALYVITTRNIVSYIWWKCGYIFIHIIETFKCKQ